MSSFVECSYPDCFRCAQKDCVVNYPQKKKKYWQNPEKSREACRLYRERKRIKEGRKSEKEIQKEKQDAIYKYIVQYLKENLYPPNVAEIQKEFGYKSDSDVTKNLSRLEERGLIKIAKWNRAYTVLGYRIVRK